MDGHADPSLGPPSDLGPSGRAAAFGYLMLFGGEFEGAVAAVRAVEQPSPYLQAVRRQVEALCLAQSFGDGPDRNDAPPDLSSVAGAMALFHWCEAAHVLGDLPDAIRVSAEALRTGVAEAGPRLWLRLALVRALLFQGEVAQASAELTRARPDATSPLALQAVRCLDAMVVGLRGEREAVVAVAEEMRSLILMPRSYADSGLALLGAFGLAMCGFPAAAAELLRYGGGGPGLPLLPPALRAYGYDLLVEAAAEGGNVELAEWILLEFDRLDLGANQQMLAARDAARARFRIAAGEVLEGVVAAEAAALKAAEARSELIGTRALLAAARGTVTAAVDADRIRALLDSVGSEDLRDWVHRSLAASGREARPLTGVGWDQLTPTQRVVARLAARGLRNQEIADLLVVSPRTVEVHVAAVLDALGVVNRVGIVGAVRGGDTPDRLLLDTFTPRQRDVALHVVQGRTNAEIARGLAVTEKTVEKHMSALLKAVGVPTRAALTARLLGGEEQAG